jgi:hypothetical protein
MGLSKEPMCSDDTSKRVTGKQTEHLQLLAGDVHVIAACFIRKLAVLASLVKIAKSGRYHAHTHSLRMPYCPKKVRFSPEARVPFATKLQCFLKKVVRSLSILGIEFLSMLMRVPLAYSLISTSPTFQPQIGWTLSI